MAPSSKRPSQTMKVLQADDPRPQRVAQLPSDPRRPQRGDPSADAEADREMQAEYGMQESEYKAAFLYVERGPGAGQLLEVRPGTVVVGRASISDLRLQHPSISRRHTQLKRVGEQFFVKDLGSQNGTFINKHRIATEVEVKPGDSIALGNALIRLRGPLAKGERLPNKVTVTPAAKRRASTGVLVRPVRGPSPAVKIALVAGAAGFGLAAALAFIFVKVTTHDKAQAPRVAVSNIAEQETEKAKLIDEAIRRKMTEEPVKTAPPQPPEEEQQVEADETITVKEQPKAPVVTVAPKAAPPTRKAGTEAETPEPKSGGSKRAQLLAPYEKGNAEAALEAAKQAGDKELTDKLSRFIAAYDAANDAVSSNNGSAAIANFQKALQLDEQLSSGWGKYGGEIRRQLANLYVLVGLQFVSNGEPEKAKVAFQAAIKHDPNHARAKQQLARLGVAAPNPDEAFEEPTPATKPAAKKTSKGSIDDAFGD